MSLFNQIENYKTAFFLLRCNLEESDSEPGPIRQHLSEVKTWSVSPGAFMFMDSVT